MKLLKMILIGFAAILILQIKSYCQPNQPTLLIDTNAAIQTEGFSANLATNPPLSDKDYTNKTAALMGAYRQEKIDKGVAMAEAMILEHNRAQNIYGKVIDQYGQPIAGVEVTGSVMIFDRFSADGENHKEYKTQTDMNGIFQFTGLRGSRWGVDLGKQGYEIDYRGGENGHQNSKTSPDNRAIFTMWKLRGPEPMMHSKLHAYILCDGSVIKFDLLTGKKNPDGDLIVNLTRNPLNIDRRRPFNWSVTLEIPNGGFQDITNLYPNEAPAEGYQSTMTLDFPTNKVGWQPEFQHAYYFKSRDGQVYGRMTINIMANFQPPPTLFDVEIYANPGGSRNLEFDYKKQIR